MHPPSTAALPRADLPRRGPAGTPGAPVAVSTALCARRALALSAALHLTLGAAAGWVAWQGPAARSARPEPGLGAREAAVLLEPPRQDALEDDRASQPEPLALAPFPEPTDLPSPAEVPPEPLPEVELAWSAEDPPPVLPDGSLPLHVAGRRLRVASRPAPAPAPQAAPPTAAPSAASTPAASAAARRGSSLRLRHGPKPPLPAGYRLPGEVAVVLVFRVGGDGVVGAVSVAASSGDDRLDRHVRDFVARNWRFEPTDTPRWVTQVVRFREGLR